MPDLVFDAPEVWRTQIQELDKEAASLAFGIPRLEAQMRRAKDRLATIQDTRRLLAEAVARQQKTDLPREIDVSWSEDRTKVTARNVTTQPR